MNWSIPILLIVGLLPSAAAPIRRDSGYQNEASATQYFVAIFSLGPSWDKAKPANEQIGFKEHSENLRRLRTEKKITLGGRFSDKGMVVVEASNEDEARAMFAMDVMVKGKVFTLDLHPFKSFFKGCVE